MASTFRDAYCTTTFRSPIAPMKKMAHMRRRHRLLILNWSQGRRQICRDIAESCTTQANGPHKTIVWFFLYRKSEKWRDFTSLARLSSLIRLTYLNIVINNKLIKLRNNYINPSFVVEKKYDDAFLYSVNYS